VSDPPPEPPGDPASDPAPAPTDEAAEAPGPAAPAAPLGRSGPRPSTAPWLFGGFNVAVLVGYCGLIALLMVAIVWYVDAGSLRKAVGSREIRWAFALSLISSTITTALAVLVAVPSAYVLARSRFRGAAVLDALLDVSIVLPPIVVGVALLVLFKMGRDMAAAGPLALRLPGGLLTWLGDIFIYTPAGIVLAQFLCSATYVVRVVEASFREVDPRGEAVALTLGCTRAQAFRMVTLPQIRPGIVAGATLAWARAIGIFGPVMIVAGAVRGKTMVLPTAVYMELSVGELEMALAVSLVMVAACIAVLLGFRLLTDAPLFGGAGGAGPRGGAR